MTNLDSFTDILGEVDEICDSQPISLSSSNGSLCEQPAQIIQDHTKAIRPSKHTGQQGDFRSVEEIDPKYRSVFTYPFFNLVQSRVIDEALYSDKSMVVCAPTGSGKTVIFEMAIVQLLMDLDDKNYKDDFKIIYMAPVKALCTERLTEWYPKLTRLGLMCIEVTGDTDVDFSQLKPYRVIITTPEKWDMLTRRWRDHRGLVEMIKLFLIDEVHILNDDTRGPVLEAVVSRMKTIESSAQSAHRIEQLKQQYEGQYNTMPCKEGSGPRIRFVAVSATVSNPDDVAAWLGIKEKPAVFYKFGDECRPVKIKRVVEGYPCSEGTSIFKFDIILNYKLWPVIQKYHNGKPTLVSIPPEIFCNTRKSVALTAETLSRELTINFTPEQKARLTSLASTIKNKKLQALVLSGVGCHHAGLLYEERFNIEKAFRNRDLPILITTTTLAMGVNLPAHLVIVKNTQQYVNGAYQEYSISTVLQMVGRAGRPQFDTEATAVIMTRLCDKARYQALVGGSEPLQSFLHKRLAENLNSEAALGTVTDVAQCVQWLQSTFLYVRAAREPKRYLGLPPAAPTYLISKKIEELCVKAMNGLASAGLIAMDEASCIESTEAGRLMSIYYLDLETMKNIMKIEGTESLERLLWVICESHELADMHLRVDERRNLNALNRNNAAATIRYPMKGKITTRQMKLNCIIQAILGCLPIPDPSLNQEAMKIMRIADRVCKCLVAYVTRPEVISAQPQYFSAVLNSITLAKCLAAHLWENSTYVSKQLKGIGPTFSTLLATAGKTNFMLLEESHPRDLERIMNKGAPAGNILRKQVSLLPKYQLTMTPIDEKRVSMQVSLLNQACLAQNMEQLTAGENHKCYLVVGDSENHLISLTLFKDKDLISVYDGTITREIIRKHNFEHKLFVHCISSNFVGIDTQCEYIFKDLEPLFIRGEASVSNLTEVRNPKKIIKKQTTVTDVFKQRKRKNDDDITQSKEKKKRDNALLEKFKYLKQSFAMASKEINEELHKSASESRKIIHEMIPRGIPAVSNNMNKNRIVKNTKNDESVLDKNVFNDIDQLEEGSTKNNVNDYAEMIGEDDDCFMVDDRIDSILNEIEKEISKKTNPPEIPKDTVNKTVLKSNYYSINTMETPLQNALFSEPKNKTKTNYQRVNNSHPYESGKQKCKRSNARSNYNFMNLLEKNVNLSDDDDEPKKSMPEKSTGFSDAIKSEVEKFLKGTRNTSTANYTDVAVKELLGKDTEIHRSYGNLNETTVAQMNLQEPDTLNIPKICSNNTDGNVENPVNTESIEHILTACEQQDCVEIVDLVNERNEQIVDLVSESNDDLSDNHLKEILVSLDHQKFSETYTSRHTKLQDYSLSNNKADIHNIATDFDPTILDPEINNKLHKQDIDEQNYIHDLPAINITKKHVIDHDLENFSVQTLNSNELQLPDTNETVSEVHPRDETNRIETSKILLVPVNNELIEREKLAMNKRIDLLYESLIHKDIGQHEYAYINKTNDIEKVNNEKQENHQVIRKTNIAEKALPVQNTISKEMVPFCLSKYNSNDQESICRPAGKIIDQNLSVLENTILSKLPSHNFNNSRKSLPGTNQVPHIRPAMKIPGHNISASENTKSASSSPYFDVDEAVKCLPIHDKFTNTKKSSNQGYVNKYSFTATKVDVSTKNTPQHRVQIIRKLKFDLDVTEIVSSKGNDTKNNDINSIEIVSLNENISDSKNNKETSKQNNLIKPGKAENKTKWLSSIHFKNNARMETENIDDTVVVIGKDESTAKIIPKYTTNVSTVTPTEKDNPDLKTNEHPETIKPKIDGVPEGATTNLHSSCSAANKVESLLQKYSAILRTNKDIFPNVEKNLIKSIATNLNTIASKPPVPKFKRPYKISDIQNLDVALPRTLIVEASRNPKPTNDAILARIKGMDHSEVKINKEFINNHMKMSQNTCVDENLLDEIPDCDSPIHEMAQLDEPSTDFKMDQLMFNPKTLLQFFSTEDPDEIIPPPEEFCDSVYSPTQPENDYNFHKEFNDYDEAQYERENFLDTSTEYRESDKSIFEGNSQQNNVLTPTKEIETWSLSQDDDGWSPNNSFHMFNGSKSYTTMRNINSPRDRFLSQGNFNSRNAKLGQFKLKHKSKLRM